jgi:beta-glucosidase
MRFSRRVAAIVVVVAALSSVVAGGVIAGSRSSDETALRPSRGAPDRGIEQKVDRLLAKMTVDEKLQQIQLLSDGQITDADAKAGVGGVFSLTDPEKINHFQHVAVEESRLHIPILFAYDTIHGYRTIFPAPLGAASSFDPSVAEHDATIGARESALVGLKQIYSPMLDVSHEPRWGRIAEGNGEDPYLGAAMGAARVKGAQGDDYSASDKVVTSPKHYAAYGQPEGGRDYNTTDMSEQRLRNLYLPPFKAAIDAGADTVMCSFNAISGVPGCANPHTETDILKHEWDFDGFIESDYTAVAETRACPPKNPDTGPCGHGVAADGPDAGAQALNAGTDSEMVSTNIRDFGKQLLAQHRISMKRVDDAVRRILRVKFRAGLFDNPYVDVAAAQDPANFLKPADRNTARADAAKSMVLLKNAGSALPLDPNKKTAVIGPLGDDGHDMLGPWWGKGEDGDAVTLFNGIKAQSAGATVEKACSLSNDEPPAYDPSKDCTSANGFAEAKAAAAGADQVVLALGETREMSGEAAARTNIDLPGDQ